jgi:hypothetical protein
MALSAECPRNAVFRPPDTPQRKAPAALPGANGGGFDEAASRQLHAHPRRTLDRSASVAIVQHGLVIALVANAVEARAFLTMGGRP